MPRAFQHQISAAAVAVAAASATILTLQYPYYIILLGGERHDDVQMDL